MVTRPKRHPTPATRFLRGEEYTDWILRPAWYSILNAHPPFHNELRTLRAEAFRTADDRKAAIHAFSRRWPGVEVKDVRGWLRDMRDGEPLGVHSRSYIWTGGLAYIEPPVVEPFHYTLTDDPKEARAEVRKRVRAVEAEMLRQIEAAEREWHGRGFRQIHPRHRSVTDKQGKHQHSAALQDGARRLFQRAVLGWSWQKIARAEYREDVLKPGEPVPDSAIREQVSEWAQQLSIQLP